MPFFFIGLHGSWRGSCEMREGKIEEVMQSNVLT